MTTTSAPKLEWIRYVNSDGNSRYGATLPGSIAYHYRIVGEYASDTIRFNVFDATGKQDELIQPGLSTVDEAKDFCQAQEDEAWAAANPPREFSDTEILDALEGELSCYRSNHGSGWVVVASGSVTQYHGKSRREAVTAYLRATTPATPATPAEPEAEPATDYFVGNEMPLRSLEKLILKNELTLTFMCDRAPSKRVNIWCEDPLDDRKIIDFYGDTIAEPLSKCLAAIEAAQHGREAAR